MSINESLTNDMKEAMKAKDKTRLSVIRMLRAALQNEAISQGIDQLSEADEIQIVSRQVKQLKESLEEFQAANRQDLIEKTKEELSIIERYMPKQLTEDEIKALVQRTIEATGATSKKDFGKVMAAVMPKVTGKADGAVVRQFVQELLP